MTRRSILLGLACTLLSIGSEAQAGKPCPWNDKQLPEKTTVCRAGTVHQCEDGQWVSLGTKCDSKYQEDGYAAQPATRRMLGEPRPQRDAVVARIAPLS